jgi:hypothetical protein
MLPLDNKKGRKREREERREKERKKGRKEENTHSLTKFTRPQLRFHKDINCLLRKRLS